MDDRITRLESSIEQLALDMKSLQLRLDALEAAGPAGARMTTDTAADHAPTGAPGAAPVVRAKDPYDPIAMLSLVGRLLLVLAGGFFLRALTEAGTLADPVGISLAFAYAVAWLFMADRAGRRQQVPGAVFHALAAAMVAFPLAVEATTRFKVLTALGSVAVVSAITAGLLFVAWRQRLRAVAWITVIGALPASAALLVQTGVVVPFAVYLVGLGTATLWLSYATGWWGSRWPAALAADIAVAGVTLRAFTPEHRDSPEVAMLLQLLLLAAYFGSVAVRTLVRARDVTHFEIVQSAAALLVSLGGAVFMARATGAMPVAFGVAAVLLGAACYAVAIAVVGRREAGALNFYFYTTLALVLVLAGFTIAADGAWLAAPLALFAVLATGLWSRLRRLFLLLHGTVYLIAAAILSGALGYCARTLVVGMDGAWVRPDALMLVVLAAGALTAGLAATRAAPQDGEIALGARFTVCIVLVWMATGSVIGTVAPAAGAMADGSVDAGVLATVRTGTLSIATLAIAWIGRRERFREWGWLVYPLLIGIGLKLMTQDFKHSRPATLFIAMGLYGAALIVAPRLRRRRAEAGALPPA